MKICRHLYSELREHDHHGRHRDEGRVLHTCSKLVVCRSITPTDESAVGSEYDGKVDEWGLFAERDVGDGDARGVGKEVEIGYGTIGWGGGV